MQDLDEQIINKLYDDLVERGHRHGSIINKIHNKLTDKAQMHYGVYIITVSKGCRDIIINSTWWDDRSPFSIKRIEINEHTTNIVSNIISRWDEVIEEHNKNTGETVPQILRRIKCRT